MRSKKTILFSHLLLTNVGCEIIIRGTMSFLARAFPHNTLTFVIPSYDAARDRAIFSDVANVCVVPMIGWKRYFRGMISKTGMDRYFWTPRFSSKHFRNADLFVSVGGDIYTMFGNKLPLDWLGYESFASRNGIPSIMFGANMERFDILCKADQTRLLNHLKRFRMIALRDKATETYLAEHGVIKNTVLFPDPIFSLRPKCTYNQGCIATIGLNVTPILLRDFGESAFSRISHIVSQLVQRGYRIKLIPHVYSREEDLRIDDRIALRKLYSLLSPESLSSVSLYDGQVSLRDITREILTTDLFVGGRMHSCLNAITLGKPTLFLSYSQKARTMVEWLQSGPMVDLCDRLSYVAVDEVTINDILKLVTAHEGAAQSQNVEINFMSNIDECLVFDMFNKTSRK